ncbi:MAG: SLC13 family permease [Chloroflexota bacterium]
MITQNANSPIASTPPRLGTYIKPTLAFLLSVVTIFGVWNGLDQLDAYARISFIVFGLSIIGWTMTKIDNTYVALAAAISFTLIGIDEPTQFFETLADPIVWLLVASFIISAGITASGLSKRLTVILAQRAKTVSHLFYLLTIVLILTAFMIPSTSGRAAVMLPIFIALSHGIKDRATVRALSLLFPTVIVLSAIASLIGAGAHLVMVDFLWHLGFERISFWRWMVLGLPFAIASSCVSVWILLRMFLSKQARRMPVQIEAHQIQENYQPRWSRTEIYTMGLIVALVALWCTEAWHGIDNTVIAIIGALIVTAPRIGLVDFKPALKSVNWTLILFMAATLKLGEALITSGGANWIVETLFAAIRDVLAGSPMLTVIVFSLIALLSHILITSRTARASVIIPLAILIATTLGFSVVPLAFLTTVGIGFCLTLTVSAKPVAMFANADERAYSPQDLLRYSAVLLPVHLFLLIVFTFYVWPLQGMTLTYNPPAKDEAPTVPQWIDSPRYEPVAANPIRSLIGLPEITTSSTDNDSDANINSTDPDTNPQNGNDVLTEAGDTNENNENNDEASNSAANEDGILEEANEAAQEAIEEANEAAQEAAEEASEAAQEATEEANEAAQEAAEEANEAAQEAAEEANEAAQEAAEEEARRQAEEEARRQAEEEARRQAEEAANHDNRDDNRDDDRDEGGDDDEDDD